MTVTIRYCTVCGYSQRAESLARRIRSELGVDPDMSLGKPGQFEVVVDGEVIATKAQPGILRTLLGASGFPDEAETVAAVRARLAGTAESA